MSVSATPTVPAPAAPVAPAAAASAASAASAAVAVAARQRKSKRKRSKSSSYDAIVGDDFINFTKPEWRAASAGNVSNATFRIGSGNLQPRPHQQRVVTRLINAVQTVAWAKGVRVPQLSDPAQHGQWQVVNSCVARG